MNTTRQDQTVMHQVLTEKFCAWCETKKPITEFIKNKTKRDGVNTNCKTCEMEQREKKACSVHVTEKLCRKCKKVRPTNQFSINKSTLTGFSGWCNDCNRWDNIRKEYGLTRQQWEVMFFKQNGLCAICNKPSVEILHVDHDHKTGAIRALLCRCCNVAIGAIFEDVAVLRAAASYLEHHKQFPADAGEAQPEQPA